MKTVIDFETYYSERDDISAAALGVSNYASRSYPYLLAISRSGRTCCGTPGEVRHLAHALAQDPDVEPWAANSNFDQAFWETLFPPFRRPWQCLGDLAAGNQYPRSVAGAAEAVLGRTPDKSPRDGMNGRHWFALSGDDEERMRRYCAADAAIEAELIEILPPLSATEAAVAAMTRRQNRRGVAVDHEMLSRQLDRVEEWREDRVREIPWSASAAPLSPRALAAWCASKGIPAPRSVDKRDTACRRIEERHPELAAVLTAMREIRTANALSEKLSTILRWVRPDNTVPLDLLYCGAPHTRRWSSRGVNVQNLARDPLRFKIRGAPVEVDMRGWIRARPGHRLYVVDYAQIEPRVLQWLAWRRFDDARAGQVLDMMRGGMSVYEAYARAVGRWSTAAPLKSSDPGLYHEIKAAVLGLGYGMGAERYADMHGLDAADAQGRVAQFRRTNPGITKLWNYYQDTVEHAARDDAHELRLPMPSGEPLIYANPTEHHGELRACKIRGTTAPKYRLSLWGGSIVENVVQRIARDIMAARALALDGAGVDVLWTSHDEVICEVPASRATADTATEVDRILTTAPVWAEDLPLAVDGAYVGRYCKL